MEETWTCPFCNATSVLDDAMMQKDTSELHLENSEGMKELVTVWTVCPYENCRRVSLSCYLYEIILDPSDTGFPKRDRLIRKWNLVPGY
ncbi:MAG: hypothetical protein JXR52_11725 [Bacteroidales bacterium]|nr:hypothetical protein [Bacteroidales bacterium]